MSERVAVAPRPKDIKLTEPTRTGNEKIPYSELRGMRGPGDSALSLLHVMLPNHIMGANGRRTQSISDGHAEANFGSVARIVINDKAEMTMATGQSDEQVTHNLAESTVTLNDSSTTFELPGYTNAEQDYSVGKSIAISRKGIASTIAYEPVDGVHDILPHISDDHQPTSLTLPQASEDDDPTKYSLKGAWKEITGEGVKYTLPAKDHFTASVVTTIEMTLDKVTVTDKIVSLGQVNRDPDAVVAHQLLDAQRQIHAGRSALTVTAPPLLNEGQGDVVKDLEKAAEKARKAAETAALQAQQQQETAEQAVKRAEQDRKIADRIPSYKNPSIISNEARKMLGSDVSHIDADTLRANVRESAADPTSVAEPLHTSFPTFTADIFTTATSPEPSTGLSQKTNRALADDLRRIDAPQSEYPALHSDVARRALGVDIRDPHVQEVIENTLKLVKESSDGPRRDGGIKVIFSSFPSTNEGGLQPITEEPEANLADSVSQRIDTFNAKVEQKGPRPKAIVG